MSANTNDKIDRFVQDVLSSDEEKGEIFISLQKIISKINPNAEEEIKYGGLVFNADSKLICGIFVRKKHISLEFSFGMVMSDPDEHLEGIGKFRRHLKIFNKNDIKDKKVEFYVNQSFNPK